MNDTVAGWRSPCGLRPEFLSSYPRFCPKRALAVEGVDGRFHKTRERVS